LIVNNASTAPSAGGCQLNYVLDSDIYAVCVSAGRAAGLALEQTQFSRISGAGTAQGTGGRSLVLENGFNFSNTFLALDLEVSPTCQPPGSAWRSQEAIDDSRSRSRNRGGVSHATRRRQADLADAPRSDRVLHLGRLGFSKRYHAISRSLPVQPGGLFPQLSAGAARARAGAVTDFPVGYDTTYTPRSYEPVGFAELRALAESHDITRLAIETRKDQIEKLEWTIKSRDDRHPEADAPARIERLTEFWRMPDGEQPVATWLREALEDVLVLDAPAFEIRRNRGGEIIGLDVVDGSTIKVLVDDTGRRPQPPAPAHEQVIHGRPWRLLRDAELIYLPHKAYGFSPVEQIVLTVNIGLRRQAMQLQHFTEGNVPSGLMSAPDG